MDEKLINNIFHLVVLLTLILALLGVLIFTGILGCNVIPGGCDVYYLVVKGGSPTVLIAYGEGGLGNHKALEAMFNDRSIMNARVKSQEIDKLSYGSITDYDLIIVEEAKKICSSQLRIFEHYVNSGGRLVWTGDAGTELCMDDSDGTKYNQYDSYLLENEREGGESGKIIGPWARKEFDKQLSFDQLLGINYKGNYCEFADCEIFEETGRIELTDNDHKLTYGLSPSIPYKGDFAIVQLNSSSNVRLAAALDYGTNLLGEADKPWLEPGKTDFGIRLPFITTSQLGERVAYYAAPLEEFNREDQKYKALIEQMYYGMLYN